MSVRSDSVTFESDRRLIVCEGISDKNFIAALCERHGISGFQFAHTAQGSEDGAGGFDVFDKYLSRVPALAKSENIQDIVLFCDSGENQDKQFQKLQRKVSRVRAKGIGGIQISFTPPEAPNILSRNGRPRVHVLMIPKCEKGGIETLCLRAARSGITNVDRIIEAVDVFADAVCDGWTTEKKDKLRLQAFISACAKRKPDLHFYQLFNMTSDNIVPLDSPHFSQIHDFLRHVSELEA